MAHSFPPTPWTQQFFLFCVSIEGWYDCVINNKDLIFIERQTFKPFAADATIFDLFYWMRSTQLADPLQANSKALRNCLSPGKSRLLDARNYFDFLSKKFANYGRLTSFIRLDELKQHAEEVYRYKFGDPRI